jgi:hypothetical protein
MNGMICPDGQISNFLSSPVCKNILIFRRPKSVYTTAVPAHPKGAFAIVTDAGRGMRWTRMVL